MADILAQLQLIFGDVLDNPKLRIGRTSDASNVPGWDSLAHLNLVTAVEQEFGVDFTLAELQEMRNVGEMIDLIEKKLAASGRI